MLVARSSHRRTRRTTRRARLCPRRYDTAGNLGNSFDAQGNNPTAPNHNNSYDEKGRLVRTKLGTADSAAPSVYHYYNADGKLIYQNGTGQTGPHSQGAYYFWLGDIPVGYFNGSGVYNIYADHLNTPRSLYNWNEAWSGSLQPVWQWHYSAYGGNQPVVRRHQFKPHYWDALNLGATQEDTSSPDLVFDIRYPGQYYDHSTGLHQNWMRMYDPTTGRYTRADPIGLNGGMNRYAYVGGNALWDVDPEGLAGARTVRRFVPMNGGGYMGPYYTSQVTQTVNQIRNNYAPNYQGYNIVRAPGQHYTARDVAHVRDVLRQVQDSLQCTSKTLPPLLPRNPNDLLRRGYSETSHPSAKMRGHRTFENERTGDRVRFDRGKPGASGYEGIDHYHRYNPNRTGKHNEYLDRLGNPCARGCGPSHLIP